MESETIVKLVIAVFVLALMAAAVVALFKGKGGDVLSSIANLLRFGK